MSNNTSNNKPLTWAQQRKMGMLSSQQKPLTWTEHRKLKQTQNTSNK